LEAEVEKRTAELRAAQAKLLEQSREKLGLSLSRFTFQFQFQWGSFTRPDSERFKEILALTVAYEGFHHFLSACTRLFVPCVTFGSSDLLELTILTKC
jgi:hypothetical protein